MKVLVVGTGSIGKRHIANLLELGAEVRAFSYRPDAQTLDPRVIRVPDLAAALASDIDAVVVANRTDQHMDVALQAAQAGKHLFLEKPLAASMAGVSELVTTVQQKGLVVEAGFMLHAHPNLLWIRDCLSQGLLGEVWHMRAAVGQWLPDWRPGTDHRQGYGAFKALGGDRYQASGKLSIKGKTTDISLPVTVKREAAATVFEGSLPVSRQTFGIGDPSWNEVVEDLVTVKFRIVQPR